MCMWLIGMQSLFQDCSYRGMRDSILIEYALEVLAMLQDYLEPFKQRNKQEP